MTNLDCGISKSDSRNLVRTEPGRWTVVSSIRNQATLVYDATLGTNIKSRIERLERNPARAAGLKLARQRLGRSLQAADEHKQHSLAALRLQAGLSQEKLAELMDMQQPNIARLERSPGNLHASTVMKLAKALGVDPMLILQITATVESETRHVK